MPVRVSYPGVYVREVPSGVRTITGVSTSIAAFVGMIGRGKLNTPTRVLSFADYQRKFGTDTTASEMTDQVRQFFLNGGQEAWITRIASFPGTDETDEFPGAANVQLRNEAGNPVLTIYACEAGTDGNLIRIEVDYNTAQPEQTFNLRAFRPVTNVFGVEQIEADETFSELSMDPLNGRYVETIINQQSELIRVGVEDGLEASQGFALSGLLFETDDTAIDTLNSRLSSASNSIQISVDDSPPVLVTLPNSIEAIEEIALAINEALARAASSSRVEVDWEALGLTDARYLVIRSQSIPEIPNSGISVTIQPAPANDTATRLQLGVAQGGVEVSGYAALRPALSGFFARIGTTNEGEEVIALSTFAEVSDFGTWELSDSSGFGPHTDTPLFVRPGTPMHNGTVYDVQPDPPTDPPPNPGVGSLRNVRQNLQRLVSSINDNAQRPNSQQLWEASLQGYRLVLRSRFGGANSDTTATLTSTPASLDPPVYDLGGTDRFFNGTVNVLSYSLGSTGIGNFQMSSQDGIPGGIPTQQDYREAFNRIDRNVDLFNLLILPRANGQGDPDREALWGLASSFCQRRRAFVLVDPRETWETTDDVDSEIADVRIGLVKDHAAIYWPRVRIPTASGGLRTIDPSGSIAGVMARTDSNRGVWKAPAGLEADIRGIRGIEYSISDPENGIINPQAVNAIPTFPNGIVVWGARTMDGFDNSGNDDYKYVPIRRLALFIEESLFRGLKFAVFEPNDEPLWAQIRLAAGAFMNNLFRQGAFQGQKARDAYFVKVDSETTTQNDINLGIVNVVVGFAPLKPAEFVVITIQQMAGQVQT